jgi:hypothetical protein
MKQGPSARTSTVAHFAGRATRGDGDGLVAAVDIEQEEAADHFLGLGEPPVQHLGLAAADLHAGGLAVPRQRLDAKRHAFGLQRFSNSTIRPYTPSPCACVRVAR